MIELIAGMAIGSIILSLGVFAANQSMRTLRMETIKLNASRMMNAAQSFYEAHCSDPSPPPLSVNRLLNEGHLATEHYRHNPYGSWINVRILWGTPSVVQVVTNMDAGASMESYQHSLGATRYAGRSLIWEEAPRIHTRPAGTVTIQNLQLHEPNACR